MKTLKLISNVTIHFKPRHLHKALLDPRLDSLPQFRRVDEGFNIKKHNVHCTFSPVGEFSHKI